MYLYTVYSVFFFHLTKLFLISSIFRRLFQFCRYEFETFHIKGEMTFIIMSRRSIFFFIKCYLCFPHEDSLIL